MIFHDDGLAHVRGLVFKARRLVYHSTLGWRVTKKRRSAGDGAPATSVRFPSSKRL